jgi:membrane protein
MVDRIKNYLSEGLWNFPLSQESGWRRFAFKWLRVAYLSLRGFHRDRCNLSASSLTYYTLMSIVPILALAFAIARGFGYNETLRNELLQHFSEQHAAFTELFKFADALLDQARGGVVAGIGLIFLFVTVIGLLTNLEKIFNHIWLVKKTRSWKRLLSDYLALMLIAPIIFVVGSSMAVFAVEYLEVGIRILPVSPLAVSWLLFLVNMIPYCLFWILFTFIYLFMPNTKIHFRSAGLAGLFAAVLYLIAQWGYIYFQIGVGRYGAVYGSMAALPLFLIWVQVSWVLLLFGAEISYAHQTLEDHEFESMAKKASHSYKQLIALWMVHLAVKKGFVSYELFVKRFQVPMALVKPILQELVECEILHEARGGFVPDRNALEMRISDVIEILESNGENDFPMIDSRALASFEKALEFFRKTIESTPENIRLSHVPHTI